jgi:branched-chain amino acid transport system permease protein
MATAPRTIASPRPNPLRHYAPRLGVYLLGAAVLAAVSAVVPLHASPYTVQIAVIVGCNIILAVSLNLVNGFAGQFSIGHAGFMAIGAYTTAKISVELGQKWLSGYAGTPNDAIVASAYLIPLMLVGGLVAAFAGLLVGLPSLRLRGDYLAIATLGFGEIIRVLLLNTEAVGGATGLTGIPQYTNLFLVFGAAIITIIAIRNLMTSVHGRAILAVREDETAAEALGIDCAHYKTAAFVIGAFFAGVAGCLYAHYTLQYLNPRMFDFMKSIELVLIVVLGGGTIWGAVIAAVVMTFLPEGLRKVKDVFHLQTDPRMVIYASLLIGVMLVKGRSWGQTVGRKRGGGGDG